MTSPQSSQGGAWAAIRDALRGVPHDYTQGSLSRAILLLAVPMVLEMVMESVFAVADIWFVSRLGSSEAVAAVGLTESVLSLVYAVSLGLAAATTAMVARRIGEKDQGGAVTAAAQALGCGLALAALFGLPAALFAGDILGLMGADAATVAAGSGYTALVLGGNGVVMFLFLNNAIARGAGDAALAMRSLWLANLVNLALDPCLIFGLGPFPELGVTGAGLATLLGRGTGVAYQFWSLRRGTHHLRLGGPAFRIDLSVARRLLRTSVGGIGQYLIGTSSWIVLIRIVSDFGPAATAGYTVAVRVVMFAFLPSWGLSNAAATLVGQNLGAGKPERAERSVWLTGWLNMAYMTVVTLASLFLADEVLSLFALEPEVAEVGRAVLKVLGYGYVIYGWAMVMIQAFNGAGDTMTPTRINLVCFWACEIPLAWALAHPAGLGPRGVFWSVVLSEALMAALAMWGFRRGRWKLQQV